MGQKSVNSDRANSDMAKFQRTEVNVESNARTRDWVMQNDSKISIQRSNSDKAILLAPPVQPRRKISQHSHISHHPVAEEWRMPEQGRQLTSPIPSYYQGSQTGTVYAESVTVPNRKQSQVTRPVNMSPKTNINSFDPRQAYNPPTYSQYNQPPYEPQVYTSSTIQVRSV